MEYMAPDTGTGKRSHFWLLVLFPDAWAINGAIIEDKDPQETMERDPGEYKKMCRSVFIAKLSISIGLDINGAICFPTFLK
jgi:hypothetical protein